MNSRRCRPSRKSLTKYLAIICKGIYAAKLVVGRRQSIRIRQTTASLNGWHKVIHLFRAHPRHRENLQPSYQCSDILVQILYLTEQRGEPQSTDARTLRDKLTKRSTHLASPWVPLWISKAITKAHSPHRQGPADFYKLYCRSERGRNYGLAIATRIQVISTQNWVFAAIDSMLKCFNSH